MRLERIDKSNLGKGEDIWVGGEHADIFAFIHHMSAKPEDRSQGIAFRDLPNDYYYRVHMSTEEMLQLRDKMSRCLYQIDRLRRSEPAADETAETGSDPTPAGEKEAEGAR